MAIANTTGIGQILHPETISRFKKNRFILEMSEDAFRDRVITKAISNRPIAERYNAAIAIGLALQACYLMNIEEKARIFPWIIESLSLARDGFMASVDSDGRHSLTAFVNYYLVGRDSVACKILNEKFDQIRRALIQDGMSESDKELREFWILIGLLESGSLEGLEAKVRDFHPSDVRLLLAIHMGCWLLENHRIADKHEKKLAAQICSQLGSRIAHLRLQLLQEFKSDLLEWQKGEIKAIELAKPENS